LYSKFCVCSAQKSAAGNDVLLLNMFGVFGYYSCVSCAFIRDQKCNNMVQMLDRFCIVLYENVVMLRSLLT